MSRNRELARVIRDYDERSRALGAFGVWGESDCLHFAVDAARAAGRSDLRARLPNYSTELGARRALKRLGFETLTDLMDDWAQRIPSARALPGDITFEPAPGLGAFGVVVGADAVFLAEGGGLWRAPIAGRFVWRA